MRDNVTVLYRGARYELGRGPGFYGIWLTGAPQDQPFEWWHETPEGWYGAWHRLTSIETPGTIMPVGQPVQASPPGPASQPAQPAQASQPYSQEHFGQPAQPAQASQPYSQEHFGQPAHQPAHQPFGQEPFGQEPFGQGPFGQQAQPSYGQQAQPSYGQQAQPSYGQPTQPVRSAATRSAQAITAAALLGGGALFSLIGLFPGYFGSQSLTSVAANLVPHIFYLAAWAAAATLLLLGGWRQRAGALLAVGVSVVTLGLFLADLGTALSGHPAPGAGGGMVLSLLGWLLAAGGAVVGLLLAPATWPARPRGSARLLTLGLATVIAIGAVIAFAPSWDSFTVKQASGAVHTYTFGNAFSNPGPVIAADVIVMILFVAVVVAAALWQPVRDGAVLLAAAIVPFLAQAISALVQLTQPAAPQFGLTPAQAAREGLTITSGLTPVFWIYCVLVAALIGLCAWMFVPRRQVTPGTTAPTPVTTMS